MNYLPNHHNADAKHINVLKLGFVIKVSILMMFMMNSNPVVETYSNNFIYFFIIVNYKMLIMISLSMSFHESQSKDTYFSGKNIV